MTSLSSRLRQPKDQATKISFSSLSSYCILIFSEGKKFAPQYKFVFQNAQQDLAIHNSLLHRQQISPISPCHQSQGYTSKYPSLEMQAMASQHFAGGKLCDRNVCSTADTTPQNRDERCPPDSLSTHKHTQSSSTGAQTHSDQLPLHQYWGTVTIYLIPGFPSLEFS